MKFLYDPMTLMELLCLQLKTEARSIYNVYLSESAPYSVNIDDTAKVEEKDLDQPTPDMFNNAQAQVCFKSTSPTHPKKCSDVLFTKSLSFSVCVVDI